MPGIRGQVPVRPQPNTHRSKVWQSMRILRRFSISDLCRTSGARRNNVRKFLWALERHGYVGKSGDRMRGRTGSFQGWRIICDCGPYYPTRCAACGRPIGQPCNRSLKEIDG